MAVIHIDGKSVEVDGADNLLEACLSLGIDVPYFCYHPALGSVGSCRQCAVKQYNNAEDAEAGKGRLVMSCMTAPTQDMYISVDDAEAKAFRASMVEFLMTNHPHDCPTCPEGGHCHLQDMTYMSGHNQRRYRFTKRTHQNQYLGPFIKHEMNRCIACYRCVRFYKDYAGGDDLGVYASANRVYFGREADGQLQSEFSGNLTEVCPTGVFTDKTHADHYNRKWDMQYAPSICHGCSAGCNISPGERYGEIRRIENRYNGEVNGYFLCDLGRFSYGYVNRDDRPTNPLERINGKTVKISLDYALDEAVKRLKDKKVIGIGSPRASLETNFALKKLVGFDNFSTGLNQHQQSLVETCIDILKTDGIHNASLKEIESHDAVLVLGEDITQTSSRVALAVRQSAKNKALKMAEALKTQDWLAEPVKRIGQNELSPVYVIDSVQTKLDDISKISCIATPEDIATLGFAVAKAIASVDASQDVQNLSVDAFKASEASNSEHGDGHDDDKNDTSDEHEGQDHEQSQMNQLAQQIAIDLLQANQPLVVSGTSLFHQPIIEASAQIVHALSDKRQAIQTAEQERVTAHNDRISRLQAEQASYQPQEDEDLSAKPKKQAGDEKQDDVRDPATGEQLEQRQVNEQYQSQASIYLCVPDANSIGVCLLGGKPLEELLAHDFEQVQTVIVAENQLTDAISVEKLANLLNDKKVIALDHQFLHWHEYVGLVLPSASFAEADGTLVSAEGRAQRFFQVYDPRYYHPNSDIVEGWRWLHALQTSIEGLPTAWTQLDDVINELIRTHPNLALIKDVAPTADFRITGLKVAREPRRYSGRTAMRAPLSVHEPMQPKDRDTSLTFSMEGYQGEKTPSSMIPFAWSAGWNSPQAWNKYQDHVGGHLKHGDPGIRLFDALEAEQRLPKKEYTAPSQTVMPKSSLFEGRAKLIPIYDMFAKSPMGSRSPVVESQLPEPAFYVSVDDAERWQLSGKDWLAISIDGLRIELPVKLVEHLAEGCIGYPVGQVPIIHPNMPTAVTKIDPPARLVEESLGDLTQAPNQIPTTGGLDSNSVQQTGA